MVAIVYATSPFVIFSLKGSGISGPKDLEGKTIAAPSTDGMRTMFPVFAKVTGINPDKVRWADIPIDKKDSALINREVDAMTSGLQQRPLLTKIAARQNLEVETLRWRDFGFELYSNGLLVTDEVIATKPELVRAFVQASIRGFIATFDNVDEAVAIMLKHNSHLEADIVRAEVEIVRDMAMSDEARQNGLGWIGDQTMQKTVDAVTEVFRVERPSVSSLYTNDFLK
jgi:NitT/TauT family transport system substrate-binding protein